MSIINVMKKARNIQFTARKKLPARDIEEVLLDVNEIAKDQDYCQVLGLRVSLNNKILAFGIDTVSRRQYEIRFKDLGSGEYYQDKIKNTTGQGTWANDNMTFFYPIKDPVTLRADHIKKHRLGQIGEDISVYYEEDETFWAFVYKSKSEDYIFFGSYSTLATEYSYLKADQPDDDLQLLQARERGLEYDAFHFKDKFYIKTNLDAKNFRLMQTPISATTKENWTEVIPHREDVLLESVEIFNTHFVLQERKSAINSNSGSSLGRQ